MTARPRHFRRQFRFVGPLLIGIAMAAMLVLTWNRWPDPLVDFGRELYIPWQLSAGKVLYRDIAHLNGPLSQYFNAMIFRIFGASLRVLVMTNIAISIAMVVMIWKLFRAAGDRVSATVACLLFVTLFMAMQYVSIGNYNWITPYSHELTHGIALSLAAILALMRFRIRPRADVAMLCGVLVGLIFLTKPEVFLAGSIVIVGGFAFSRPPTRSIAAFALGAGLPLIISTLALSWRATLGAWPYLFDQRLAGMKFYKIGMGTDSPRDSVIGALLQAGCYLVMLLPAFAIDFKLRQRSFALRFAVACAYVALLIGSLEFAAHRDLIVWRESLLGLTPVMIAGCLASIFWIDKRRPRGLLRALLIFFATLLLGKIFLASRVYHYGFALALPATATASAMAVSWIPRRGDFVSKSAAIALLALLVCHNVGDYAKRFRDKSAIVAGGSSDEFLAGARGRTLIDIVAGLRHLPASATLAIVPEGAMVNYLTGHINSTPFLTLMPPEVFSFGDDRIATSYARNPPDFVVVIPVEFGEYGFSSFDAFAPLTAAYIRSRYDVLAIQQHGSTKVVLLQRKS